MPFTRIYVPQKEASFVISHSKLIRQGKTLSNAPLSFFSSKLKYYTTHVMDIPNVILDQDDLLTRIDLYPRRSLGRVAEDCFAAAETKGGIPGSTSLIFYFNFLTLLYTGNADEATIEPCSTDIASKIVFFKDAAD